MGGEIEPSLQVAPRRCELGNTNLVQISMCQQFSSAVDSPQERLQLFKSTCELIAYGHTIHTPRAEYLPLGQASSKAPARCREQLPEAACERQADRCANHRGGICWPTGELACGLASVSAPDDVHPGPDKLLYSLVRYTEFPPHAPPASTTLRLSATRTRHSLLTLPLPSFDLA